MTGLGLAMRWLVMLLVPLGLGACEVAHLKMPMTLGPSDAAPPSCLSGTTTHGDCKSVPLSSAQDAR